MTTTKLKDTQLTVDHFITLSEEEINQLLVTDEVTLFKAGKKIQYKVIRNRDEWIEYQVYHEEKLSNGKMIKNVIFHFENEDFHSIDSCFERYLDCIFTHDFQIYYLNSNYEQIWFSRCVFLKNFKTNKIASKKNSHINLIECFFLKIAWLETSLEALTINYSTFNKGIKLIGCRVNSIVIFKSFIPNLTIIQMTVHSLYIADNLGFNSIFLTSLTVNDYIDFMGNKLENNSVFEFCNSRITKQATIRLENNVGHIKFINNEFNNILMDIDWFKNKIDKLFFVKENGKINKSSTILNLKGIIKVFNYYDSLDLLFEAQKWIHKFDSKIKIENTDNVFERFSARLIDWFVEFISDYFTDYRKVLNRIVMLIFTFGFFYSLFPGQFNTNSFVYNFNFFEYGFWSNIIENSHPDIYSNYLFEVLPNLMYFSLISFTTIGYGDIAPTGFMRYVAGLEGLIGVIVVAIFTITLSRKYLK